MIASSFRTIDAMATVTTTVLVDDLDGSKATETISLALDEDHYEMDLSAENAARLRDMLAKFIEAAVAIEAVPPPRITKQVIIVPSSKEQIQAIRDWARQNGFEVSKGGRIPKNVLKAFNDAH